jgi:hypothetical protein
LCTAASSLAYATPWAVSPDTSAPPANSHLTMSGEALRRPRSDAARGRAGRGWRVRVREFTALTYTKRAAA